MNQSVIDRISGAAQFESSTQIAYISSQQELPFFKSYYNFLIFSHKYISSSKMQT